MIRLSHMTVISCLISWEMGFANAEGEASGAKKPDNQPHKVLDSSTTPEEQIAKISQELSNSRIQSKAHKKLYQQVGSGGKNVLARRIFLSAKEDYRKKEYRSAIRNLNSFLNLKQTPDIQWHLESQYILGKSYQALKNYEKAFRAYRRYLETLTTNPAYIDAKTTEVMKNFLFTIEKSSNLQKNTLTQLLATIGTLNFPTEQKSLVLFYAGKSLRVLGKHRVALEWYHKSLKLTKSQFLTARVLYNRALVHLYFKEYDQSYKDLKTILKLEENQIGIYKDWTYLTLARLHVFLKKPNTALSFYEKVSDKSEAFPESLYERVYLYLNQKRSSEAVATAEEYLTRYPKSDKTYHINTLRAYLTLRDNKIERTLKYLKEGEIILDNIDNWLQENYTNRDTITSKDVMAIINRTEAHLPTPPEVLFARDKFADLARIRTRLSEVRNDIRHTVFTSGRASFETLNPASKNRTDQIDKMIKFTLKKADQLIQAEKALYQKAMPKTEALILSKASARLERYWNRTYIQKTTNESWKSWYGLASLMEQISGKYVKLKKLQAHLASLELIALTKTIRRPLARQSEIKELRAKIDLIESDVLRGMEVLRARKVLLSTSSNHLEMLRNIVKKAADDILIERQILEKYRYRFTNPTDQYLAEDIDRAWKKWDNLVQDAFAAIVEELIATRRKASLRMASIDNMIEEYNRLSARQRDTEKDMMRSIGRHMGLILEHYYAQIHARKAQHQKWYADLKWLTYDNITLKKQKAIDKIRLEQQLLQENLKDLNQGALWSWPKSSQNL